MLKDKFYIFFVIYVFFRPLVYFPGYLFVPNEYYKELFQNWIILFAYPDPGW